MPIVPVNGSLPNGIRRRISPKRYGPRRAIVEHGQILLMLHLPPERDEEGRRGVLLWRDAKGAWIFSRGTRRGSRSGTWTSTRRWRSG